MFGGFATNVKTTGYELTGDLGRCLRMGGLTFYKDFTKSGSLDADFALGSRKATYTSTSGIPTIGANGYAATTANADVLKYEIAKNRTAAQETIVIKFMPNSDFANDGVNRILLDNDGTRRILFKDATGTVLRFVADGSVQADGTTTCLNGVSYIYTLLCQTTGNPNINILNSGISENVNNTDLGVITFGSYFYLCRFNGISQLNGSVLWIKIFNRVLTASEIATLQ